MLALRSRLLGFVWLAASFVVLAGYHSAHAEGVRNLSTRGLVTPDVGMAGGIVVEGDVQVLITARGPSTGLTTALEDGSMRLFKIGGGLPPMLMMENDNWGDNDNASEISGLTVDRPLSSSEPALLVNLTSGAYSAVVSDVTVVGEGGEVVLGFTEIDDDEAEPCPNPNPVLLNNGESTLWTATLTTTGNAVYPTLEVFIAQNGAELSGQNRDNLEEVDVSSTGTIDGCGNLSLTSTITNGSNPRAVIMFTGTVSGSGSSQTISGTYTATGPSVPTPSGTESGSFSMQHSGFTVPAEPDPEPEPEPEPEPVPESCDSQSPVMLNNGETTLWTATLTTTGNAVFPTLEVLIAQSGADLSGENRDNNEEVDVSSTGTIDGCGDLSLTSTTTNGGNPRAVIMFTGTVSGSGSSQTISGTYTATGPSVPTASGTESGTFSMAHN